MVKRLVYFITLVCLVTIVLMTSLSIQLDLSLKNNLKNDTAAYWSVTDLYDRVGEKTLKEFFAEEDSLERLKEMNQILHDDYFYLEYIRQPVEYLGWYTGQETTNKMLINQEIEIDGKMTYVTPLDAMQISEETWNYFKLSCIEGRPFETADYDGNGVTQISVILGYNYHENYRLGDKIECSYLYNKVTLEVVGFLQSDLEIFDFNCDNYIIMPALKLSEPDDLWDETTQKMLYAQKNNGKIINISASSGIAENQQIKEISKELNLKYALLGYDNIVAPWIYVVLVIELLLLFGMIQLEQRFSIMRRKGMTYNLCSIVPSSILFYCIASTSNYMLLNRSILFVAACLVVSEVTAIMLRKIR